MIISVHPSRISGTIHAPASKSMMQRACAAALVRIGETEIHNPGMSDDDNAALGVIQQLGAHITMDKGQLSIYSNGIVPLSGQLDCGESGLGIRMFTPIAALSKQPITITGGGSLLNRPMHFFNKVLPQLGVHVISNNGTIPLQVQGPLQPKNIEIDGSLSSQFLTGLLFAFSAAGASDISIKVKDLKSKPYIDLTLQVMKDFDLKVPVNNNYESFYFDDQPTNGQRSTINYFIEGDWSSAAFLLVAAAVCGKIKVKGLSNTSRQADRNIIEALSLAGVCVTLDDDHVAVERKMLLPFSFDATDCPDLFPPLVALAANCKGVSFIKGLKRLQHKESDRGISLQEEFAKLNTRIDLVDDEMHIYGNEKVVVKDPVLYSHHDHRIAMACAVACLGADREVEIRDADAVKKSYPAFWDHLKQLNAAISLKPFTTDNTFRL